MFRTAPAQWFEQLIARPMLSRAIEVLASTRAVQFEFTASADPALSLASLREMLDPWRQFTRRYARYLPAPQPPGALMPERLETAIQRNLAKLQMWESTTRDTINALSGLEQETWQLRDVAEFLTLVSQDLDMGALQRATPELQARLFVLPVGVETPAAAQEILHLRVAGPGSVFLLTLGEPEATAAAEERLSGIDGRSLVIPDWLSGPLPDAIARVAEKLHDLEDRAAVMRQQIDAASRQYGLAQALGEMVRLDWLVGQLEGVPVGDYFAHLTGWTSDATGAQLRQALERANLPAVVHLAKPPPDLLPPTLIRNPGWIRPFEFFGKLMGTPGTTDAEPSAIIAIIAPLLFGYMFGDVGHGLVILLLGLVLHKRWPATAMLIPGGIVSMVFGLLYGSLFTVEGVLPVPWMNPMDAPLDILLLPMLFGAFLILLGMSLNGLEHAWEGRAGYWLRCEAGIMLAYLALLASVAAPSLLPIVIVGVAWHITGNTLERREEGIGALGSALADLFEYVLQLAVNTVSFVRVGAFALAHAGLGAAVASLAGSTESVVAVVLVMFLGNLLIIALEGLVVSVQTTRLLLFEFFIRFMRSTGRQFDPVLPPRYNTEEEP